MLYTFNHQQNGIHFLPPIRMRQAVPKRTDLTGVSFYGPALGREYPFFTYVHSVPDGIPFYVGKGSLYRAFRVKHSRNVLHQAVVAQYGAENIRVSLIECESDEEARETEKRLIAEYSLVHNLANLSTGGQGAAGYKHTVATRQKMSKSRKGVKWSQERKDSFRLARGPKRVPHSEATRRKMAASWTPERKEALRIQLLDGTHPVVPARAGRVPWNKGLKNPGSSIGRKGKVWVHRDGAPPRILDVAQANELIAEGWKLGLGGGRGGGRRWDNRGS